jgi:hypothetical protein
MAYQDVFLGLGFELVGQHGAANVEASLLLGKGSAVGFLYNHVNILRKTTV